MSENQTETRAPIPILGTAVSRILNSSKGIVVIAALAMVTFLTYRQVFTSEQALEFAKWMLGVFVASVAFEDGAKKLASGPRPDDGRFEQRLTKIANLLGSLLAAAPSRPSPDEDPKE